MPADAPAALGGEPAFPEPLRMTAPTLVNDPALHRGMAAILESGMLTNGRQVAAFEHAVEEYLGVEHAVAVASCTAGLMLMYRCLDLTGEVLMPSFTFMATGHAAVWNGLDLAFADAHPETFNLDPGAAAAAVTPMTSAVSVTHVFGAPADVDGLSDRVREVAGRALPIVVDAAHGFGARYPDGSAVGTKGTAEVFSLSPTKVLTTGEGGLVTTADAALADELRACRDYGNRGSYDCLLVGLNARMTEIAALLGQRNLGLLPSLLERRAALANRFMSHLSGLPGLHGQRIASGASSTYKDLSIRVDAAAFGLSRDALCVALTAEGIPTRRYFDPPLHRQSVYAEGGATADLPVTDELSAQMLTLPMWSHMPFDNVDRVCAAIRRLHDHRDALAGDAAEGDAVR